MEETRNGLNIIIAAGGTGGHLFPAQALARELVQKHSHVQVTFIGAGLENTPYFKKDRFSFLDIQSGTPFKKHPIQILKSLLKISKGLIQSLKFIGKNRPDLIVGFGSYHTFPVIFAAKLRKIPILIFESNALPGKVNRFCSKWAKVSAIQFSHASEYLKSKSICVRMPLLKRKKTISKEEARAYFNLEEDKLTFLVFGGSQGAESINRFICGSLAPLTQKGIEFQSIHIVGDPKRAEKLEDIYKKHHVSARVKVFEEKMEYAWAAADLNISRAGAGTLAELIEFTVPSILIPYPFGSDNHQLKNAAFVTDEVNGAVTLEEKGLRGVTVAKTIIELLDNDQEVLKEMKNALKTFKEKQNKQDLCSLVMRAL